MMNLGYGGDWENTPSYMQQMMQNYYGGIQPFIGFLGLVHLIICILVAALLVAAIRYLWNKGGKKQ